MTKSNICVIVKTNNLTKVKVGVKNLIVKEELDRIMASRLAQLGLQAPITPNNKHQLRESAIIREL